MLRKLVDSALPNLSKRYRAIRDHYIAQSWPTNQIDNKFWFIGPSAMLASRIESGELNVVEHLLGQIDVFIDVGANCGLYTMLANYCSKPVIAFEPNQKCLEALLKNVRINKCSSVEVFPLAVSHAAGVEELYGGQEGASIIRGWGGIKSNYANLVSVNTLDNTISHRFVGSRLLIKVDVEGNEYNVLLGSSNLLKREPFPIWYIEHGFTQNFADGVNPNFWALFELFWNLGYKCFSGDVKRGPIEPSDIRKWISAGSADSNINYIFTKESTQASVARCEDTLISQR
jgi:FkbM family methyltransferase